MFHVLVAMADEDRHGYGIIKDVALRTSGTVELGTGTLYGIIKRLLAEGACGRVETAAARTRRTIAGISRLSRRGST